MEIGRTRSRMKSNEAENRSGTHGWKELDDDISRSTEKRLANFDVYIAHEQGGIQFYRFRIVRWDRSLVTETSIHRLKR